MTDSPPSIVSLRSASRFRFALAGAAAALAVSVATPARADTAIAADLDWAFPIDSSADSGAGFGVRLGRQIHVPLVVVVPELGFTFHSFSGDFNPRVYRGIAGLRLGVGEILRPGVFGHAGVGHLQIDAPGPDPSHTAFTFDGGVFLDLTILPLIDIGAHAAYNRLSGSDTTGAFQWVTAGLHAALIF